MIGILRCKKIIINNSSFLTNCKSIIQLSNKSNLEYIKIQKNNFYTNYLNTNNKLILLKKYNNFFEEIINDNKSYLINYNNLEFKISVLKLIKYITVSKQIIELNNNINNFSNLIIFKFNKEYRLIKYNNIIPNHILKYYIINITVKLKKI